MIDYNNKEFRVIHNSSRGEVSEKMVFKYIQKGEVLTCNYSNGRIVQGHILGKVDDQGRIQMCYHQINVNGELRSGHCLSTPEIMGSGKIRLYESWTWTYGGQGSGSSVLEEV